MSEEVMDISLNRYEFRKVFLKKLYFQKTSELVKPKSFKNRSYFPFLNSSQIQEVLVFEDDHLLLLLPDVIECIKSVNEQVCHLTL